MTVESATNKAGPYNVTGTTGTFSRPFLIRDPSHLRVIRLRDAIETDLISGLSHTGIGTADGSVTVTTGLQAGDVIFLLRDVPSLQLSDYNAQGRVRPDQIEADLDLASMQIQDIREAQQRALTLTVSSGLSGEEALAAAIAAPQFAAQAQQAALAAQAMQFRSRAALATAISAGSVVSGQLVAVDGVPAFIDPSATGTASALHDLGVSGVRLAGRLIEARWFGLLDGIANPEAVIDAANTYAKAQKGGANSVSLVLSGVINLRNPIVLGGSTALFHIDWSALTVNVVAPGQLASNPSLYAVTCEAANSQIKCGRVNVNKICNGVRITNSDSSYVLAPNVRRFRGVGIEVTGNCAGMKLDTPVALEWVPSDPQYFIEAQYIGTGLRADSADFVVSKGTVGWCKYALWITANGNGFEAHGFHPFNGDVTATAPRQHPFCVVNEASGPAFLYDCYIDNGYIDDRSGTLRIQGGWHLVLPARVILTPPLTRIRIPTPISAYTGSISDFDTSVGFCNGGWVNDASNLRADFLIGLGAQRGNGRRVEVSRRRTRLVPFSDDTVDDLTSKQGPSGTVIRHRFYPGEVEDQRVDMEIYNGRMRLLDGGGANGSLVLSSTSRTGIGGTLNRLDVYTNGALRASFPDVGGFRPATDNDQPLGLGPFRWSVVHAGTGAINTSDARDKTDIRDLTEAEVAVAARIKELVRVFRFHDAIAEKGDAARLHIGVIAQEVAQAFIDEGLDPFSYGIVCRDEWSYQPEQLDDATGEVVMAARPAGDRWGIRYDELLMFLLVAS